MKKLLSLLVIVGLVGAGGFVALPFVTLLQINSAVEAKDSGKLNKHVNFPLLRANLKTQLRGPAGDWIQKQDKGEIEGFFAALVGSFMVDSLVDAMVTPQGLEALMNGQTDIEQIKGQAGSSGDSGDANDAQKSFRFESLSEFHLVITRPDKPPITVVLTRRGISWKMSNIILPTG